LVSFRVCGLVVTEGPIISHAELSPWPHPSVPPGLAGVCYVGKDSYLHVLGTHFLSDKDGCSS